MGPPLLEAAKAWSTPIDLVREAVRANLLVVEKVGERECIDLLGLTRWIEDLETGKAGAGSSIVYFARCGDLIKIGTTSKDVRKRIQSLQTGNPHPVVLLGIIVGTLDTEHALHRRFEPYRKRGEWFLDAPELLAFIAAHAVLGPTP